MQSLNGLAWRNLRSNRLRSILSVIAVMLGVAVTITGSTLAESVREGILQSDELRTVMEGLIGMLDPAMLFVGLMVMLAGGFLIFNTFGMAITQRRQQIGGLRALGMTRVQIMRVILTEALLLASIGVILGVPLSFILSEVLLTFVKAVAGDMLAFGDAAPTLPVVIFAIVMGSLITLLSVMLPARRAASVTPLEAMRPPDAAGISRVAVWQVIVGLVLMAGVLVIDSVAPPGAWAIFPIDVNLTMLFMLLWLIGLVLLLPGIIVLAAKSGRRLSDGLVGRLVTDNLQRARGRVTLTVMTLAFALLLLVGLTGFIQFYFIYGFGATMQKAADRDVFFVARMDLIDGWGATMARGLESIMLTDDEVQALTETVEGRASTATIYLTTIPELSFLGDAYFSYVIDPVLLQYTEENIFTFTEGDWETALPIMQAGCGILVAPTVGARLDAGTGDTVTVTGLDGPVECTVAGIGTSVAGATIVSDTLLDRLTDLNPTMFFVVPSLTTSSDELIADVVALKDTYPELNHNTMSGFVGVLEESTVMITVSLNAMLLLAMVAAAFGVVNTVMMSVEERRREIGLLRAVGTTRKQTRRIILGEAAFMGLIGGGIGCLAGLAVVWIIVMTYGFNSFGIELDLWQTALASMQTALPAAIPGLFAAPLIAALAAWFPARGILREETVAVLPRVAGS